MTDSESINLTESTDRAAEAVSSEELVARMKELQARSQARIANQEAKGGGRLGVMLRLLVLFGVPIGGAVAAYIYLDSIWWSLLALVVLFVAVVMIAMKLSPMPMVQPGTRKFEAMMNIRLLSKTIDLRLDDLAAAATEEKRLRIEKELVFLMEQRDEEEAILMSDKVLPPRGYVGIEPYGEEE